MANHDELLDFIAQAQTNGVPETSLLGILKGRGWSEKDIYEGMAAACERQTGLVVPSRVAGQTGARDAFFYLVAFSTLATWTVGLGSVAFTLIDRWLGDPLFSPDLVFELDSLPYSIASVLVAFPIYFLIARCITREIEANPGKSASPIRKWLTYLALVIAAAIFVGDLISCLSSFLHGELTLRFFANSSVVLTLSGGVFYYYFGGLRKADEAHGANRFQRDKWMAVLSTVVVAVMVVLGFVQVGNPARQRMLRADEHRVRALKNIGNQIANFRATDKQSLPVSLDEVQMVSTLDPETRTPYEYHPLENGQYQLCATFALSSPPSPTRLRRWEHQAGHYCFTLQKGQSY